MDFRFSEDQRAFADTAAALFAEHCSDDALRAHDASGAPYMQQLWPACVDMGLHGIVVPESAGGLGLGMTELIGVLAAQGGALALVPLWEHQLATAALAHFGSDALKSRLLPAAMDGSALWTASLAALADSRGVSLKLSQAGSGWRLDGHVAAVPLGGVAQHALLGAEGDDGVPRLIALDLAQAGVQHHSGIDQHHLGVADLILDGVTLDADAVLASAAHAWFEPRAIACLASLQLGVIETQLQRTVQHVSERKQFGRTISSFQLVVGALADGYITREALRTTLWQLAYRLDAGLGALPQALAVRAQACDLGYFVGHKAQHLHGGVGVDISHPMHRFLYWSRVLSATLGGSAAHLARLGDWLAEHDQLGWKYDLPENAS